MKTIVKRFWSLNSTVKWSFIISFFFLIIYKIIPCLFTNLPLESKAIFEFLEKLSYAIIGSTIFYFINQHLPKEKKKIKATLLLKWKIEILERDVVNFLGSLGIQNDMKQPLSRKEVRNRLDSFPKKMGHPISYIENNRVFQTHIEYFNFVFTKMKDTIDDIISYSDYFDEEILDYLVKTSVIIDIYNSELSPVSNNTNLSWYSFHIYAIGFNMYNLRMRFDKKFSTYLSQLKPYYETEVPNGDKLTGAS